MGVLPKAILEQYPRERGNHPLMSFCAVGPMASEVVTGQNYLNPLMPMANLAELGGKVLFLGTTLTSGTILHLAELRAGMPLLTRWALISGQKVVATKVSGCSKGFDKLENVVSQIKLSLTVHNGLWGIYDAEELLKLTTAFFIQDPTGGICDDTFCLCCITRAEYSNYK